MDIEAFLSEFDKFTKDPTLDAMRWLMGEFGDPHKKLKIIHVAGTNGKGSVCEMLSSVLVKAHDRVGKFMSPYLLRFNENISVSGREISDEEAGGILTELSVKIEEYKRKFSQPVKWFEVITSLALIYFERQNCDLVILETGLGGKTDCTNIVDPLISVITAIGYDHTDILGHTLEEIAAHKAGIIKPGSDTVMAEQPEVMAVFEKACADNRNTLHTVRASDVRRYSFDREFQTFDFERRKSVKINLKGRAQVLNALLCLKCFDLLNQKGISVPGKAVREGLRSVVHRGRFETLCETPLMIYDGGHNENAIRNLKDTIAQYYPDEKKIFIVSILKTKGYKTIIKELLACGGDSVFIFTDGNSDRYFPKETLYDEAAKAKARARVFKNGLKEAIADAAKNYPGGVIFIIGSFYVYKTVFEETEKYRLTDRTCIM